MARFYNQRLNIGFTDEEIRKMLAFRAQTWSAERSSEWKQRERNQLDVLLRERKADLTQGNE